MVVKLFEHQKKIISEDKEKIGLFMGTGSGKTLTALLLARDKTLVIAPKTQKEDRNWERELDNLIEKRKDKWKKATEITQLTVISKEIFRRDWEKLPRFDTVIADEAHTVLGVTPNIKWKNKKPFPKTSQLFEALTLYLDKTKPTRFYPCTATIIRSPMTVWGVAKVLGKDWDFYKFRDRFYFKLNIPHRDIWVVKSDNETKDYLASFVNKLGYTGRLEDYFDVPSQTYKTDYIELTPKQKQRIKELKLEYPEPIVQVGKIHQVENGVLAGDEFNDSEFFDNGKLDKLEDYALEFPRMIVFAKYTAQIDQIASKMTLLGKKVFILDGRTKDRGSLLNEAKRAKEYVFIAQAQVSSGWELPDCPVMIFASRTYSFVDSDQSLGRIQRANNLKKNLYINLVVKGGVDEAVDKCLKEKKDFSERIYAT